MAKISPILTSMCAFFYRSRQVGCAIQADRPDDIVDAMAGGNDPVFAASEARIPTAAESSSRVLPPPKMRHCAHAGSIGAEGLGKQPSRARRPDLCMERNNPPVAAIH
jgi:hypothetical protein